MTIMAIKAAVARLCSSALNKEEKKKKEKNEKKVMISSNSLSHDHPPSIAGGEFDRVFHYFDGDGDGRISPGELVRALGDQELSLERAEELVLSADTDGDGLLGLEDFVALADARGEEGEEEERGRSLEEAFEAYKGEGEECITADSLREALRRRLGETRSVEECRRMIRRFDENHDGVISFDEFRSMMMCAC